ncbi:hypothetical protein Dimus_027018 [Dionaea muscipula]
MGLADYCPHELTALGRCMLFHACLLPAQVLELLAAGCYRMSGSRLAAGLYVTWPKSCWSLRDSRQDEEELPVAAPCKEQRAIGCIGDRVMLLARCCSCDRDLLPARTVLAKDLLAPETHCLPCLSFVLLLAEGCCWPHPMKLLTACFSRGEGWPQLRWAACNCAATRADDLGNFPCWLHRPLSIGGDACYMMCIGLLILAAWKWVIAWMHGFKAHDLWSAAQVKQQLATSLRITLLHGCMARSRIHGLLATHGL